MLSLISHLDASINQLIRQFTNTLFVRHANNKAFIANRQSRTLNKLLAGKAKNKKVWYDDTPRLQSIQSLTNPASQGKSSLRRVNVLNKLFMRHITDFMATDETYAGYGLEISRVKAFNSAIYSTNSHGVLLIQVNITTDFQLVNVFWMARGDGSDEYLESVLLKSAGLLRHNLSQLRLMGEVPTIKFVKDKLYAKSVEVETLLKRADFGDDFVPSSPSQMIKNDLSCNTIQPNNVLPEMTHNILGLNHAEIMHRIKQNMSKAKQAWEKYETKLPVSLEESHTFTGEESKQTNQNISVQNLDLIFLFD